MRIVGEYKCLGCSDKTVKVKPSRVTYGPRVRTRTCARTRLTHTHTRAHTHTDAAYLPPPTPHLTRAHTYEWPIYMHVQAHAAQLYFAYILSMLWWFVRNAEESANMLISCLSPMMSETLFCSNKLSPEATLAEKHSWHFCSKGLLKKHCVCLHSSSPVCHPPPPPPRMLLSTSLLQSFIHSVKVRIYFLLLFKGMELVRLRSTRLMCKCGHNCWLLVVYGSRMFESQFCLPKPWAWVQRYKASVAQGNLVVYKYLYSEIVQH